MCSTGSYGLSHVGMNLSHADILRPETQHQYHNDADRKRPSKEPKVHKQRVAAYRTPRNRGSCSHLVCESFSSAANSIRFSVGQDLRGLPRLGAIRAGPPVHGRKGIPPRAPELDSRLIRPILGTVSERRRHPAGNGTPRTVRRFVRHCLLFPEARARLQQVQDTGSFHRGS